MEHTKNRFEEHWEQLVPLIKEHWNKLSAADFAYINFEFDRLVEVIRQRYGGRKEIIQEAAIRQKVADMLAKLESSE